MPCTKFNDTILIFCAGLLLALAMPHAALAATNCPPLASKALTATSGLSTTSTSYVNVAGTKINFVQGGTREGCVLVSFSAEASAAAGEEMEVLALLDDTENCAPGSTFFVFASATVGAGPSAYAMHFVCPDVAPGDHSIRMRYRSFGGGFVGLNRRTMIVQYVP